MDKKTQKLLAISDKVLDYAKPISLNILLTYQCNFSCKHCYIKPERSEHNDKLPLDKWKNILKYFKDIGVIYLRISGGEPTIVSFFDSLYSYAWDLGYKIEIATNGYKLNQYTDLLKTKKPYLITFSLYGLTNETYSEFCGVKDKGFDKLLMSTEFCQEQNIDYKINYILTSYNSGQMKEIFKLANQNRWEIFCLRNLQNDTDGNFEPVKCQAEIKEVIKSYYIFNDARKKIFHFMNAVWVKSYKTCYSGITHFNINPYGEIYLCNACFRIKHKIDTNISDAIEEIRKQRCVNIEKECACSRCELRYWCGLCTPIYNEKSRSNQFNQYCNEQKYIFYQLRRDFMTSYKLKYNYDFSEVEGDYIVTPKNSEATTKALVINETTYRIMKELQNDVPVCDIVDVLSKIYTISKEELFDDVKKVINELEKVELIYKNEK